MAAKTIVLLFAVLALSAAEQAKRQVVYGAYDDGSYWPGKYEGTGSPYYPYAAPYAAAPYAATPYAVAPHAALPYAATPYAAAPYAAAPYVAAPYVPNAYPYAHYGADDGKYFPGKYGPENQ